PRCGDAASPASAAWSVHVGQFGEDVDRSYIALAGIGEARRALATAGGLRTSGLRPALARGEQHQRQHRPDRRTSHGRISLHVGAEITQAGAAMESPAAAGFQQTLWLPKGN